MPVLVIDGLRPDDDTDLGIACHPDQLAYIDEDVRFHRNSQRAWPCGTP